ncbi:Bug family tripartite tricarboxylate transporter substrate binding protein [Xylophilus sp. ASV27]|uniref:Bug family tripartite tricarboxylate transporter substrate binding protein n=1 Tax=Xylophilus sp. ASV27 TaxID=2795129 RepID=UPI0018ED034A|nr:tripartite tricarboxylate transporter substrate binding protein [Xylophilus sp. ASV27]
MNRRTLATAVLALLACTGAAAQGGSYPDRPIRLIVPFPAGSITDVVARSLAEPMSLDLGQAFIIDNKPGANGIIGTQAAAQSKPDGYTLVVVGVTTAASNVSLFKKLPYDPAKDLAPIGGVAETPYLLVGSHETPGKTVGELFAWGRQHPGKLTYAYGSGSAQVFGAKLAHMGRMEVTPVSYRGGPQALTDVMSNQVNLTFTDFANGLQQAKAGRVKVYGVSTRERFALATDLPTLQESGAPGFDLTVWFGLMAPAGLPPETTQRLSASLDKALATDELVKRFAAQGLSVKLQKPAPFGDFVKSEIAKWAGIVKEVGIQPE